MSVGLRGVRAGRGTLITMLALCAAVGASRAEAQSSRAVSLQASGMAISSSDNIDAAGTNNGTRFGVEVQVRYNPPGKFSVGLGYEQSTVYQAPQSYNFSVQLQSIFVEPRYVVTTLGSSAALYVAARLSYGTLKCVNTDCASETHAGAGGGAGVLIRVSNRAGIDLGAQYYRFFTSIVGASNPPHFLFFRAGLSYGL